jgi:T4 RnlA family RNA ligase
MNFDINILNDYIQKGLVVKNDHPTLPISIYNYSRTCQYENKWNNITKSCRGLILDKDGNVIAKSFDKFFNFEEHSTEEIPNEDFEVYEKLDGSLGILFWYQDKWILASKGSFTSDQAIKGMEILKKYKYDRLLKGYTYLFEIIYPENRIVCQYDFEDLILLAVIDNSDGYEIRIHDNEIHLEGIRLKNLYNNLGFKIVKKYDGIRDYSELKSKISQNEEGFVIKFGNGFRMKIKGEEYVRLHRILTGFSNVDIWEYLKDGKDLDELLDRVPDEFDLWVKNTVKDLNKQFWEIQSSSAGFVDNYRRTRSLAHIPFDKKEFAALVMTQPKSLRPIMFSMYDGKKYDEMIWKSLRPKYSKPFWQKESNDE